MAITIICRVCKKEFKVKPSHAKRRKTCSLKCSSIWQSKYCIGKNARNWKGGIQKYPSGYVYRYLPEHPNSNKKVIPEHIFVMEKSIGRYLEKNEIVHHINRIKGDNRIENLQLMKDNEHRSYHGKINGIYSGNRHSKETKKRMSETKKGKNNPMFGKKHTIETRKKMSNAIRKYK